MAKNTDRIAIPLPITKTTNVRSDVIGLDGELVAGVWVIITVGVCANVGVASNGRISSVGIEARGVGVGGIGGNWIGREEAYNLFSSNPSISLIACPEYRRVNSPG